MTGLAGVESDIGLAGTYRVCVLITAPPAQARAIAEAIAAAAGRGHHGVRAFDGAAILQARNWGIWSASNASDTADVLIEAVDDLTWSEQRALLELLETDRAGGCRRVIATTSACLMDRVRHGTFMPALFYRLNTVHIVNEWSCPASEERSSSL
jgi:hypothetical protein